MQQKTFTSFLSCGKIFLYKTYDKGTFIMPLVSAKCTNCRANLEVDNTKDAAICPYCGTPYIVEKAINNYVINISKSVSLNKMIQNIDTLVTLKSWDKAKEICEEVITDYPEDYRGWWRCIVIDTLNFSANTISENDRKNYARAYQLSNGIFRVLIKLTFEKYKLQCDAHAKTQRVQNNLGIENAKYCNNYLPSDVEKVLGISIPMIKDELDREWHFHRYTYVYGNTVKFEMYHEHLSVDDNDKLRKKYDITVKSTQSKVCVENNIAELLSGYKTKSEQQSCYIATCVYGSYDCPEVWTLRRFRDYILDETWYGRLFIKCYYAISPTLVRWFGNQKWFRTFWRNRLDSMVSGLNSKGVENTVYIDKY